MTLMSAAIAWIQSCTANSGASASSGKDQETEEKRKYRWGNRKMKDGETGRWGDGETFQLRNGKRWIGR
jgi:hypothetical protein